jgi:phage baseplate assembly protein gpV
MAFYELAEALREIAERLQEQNRRIGGSMWRGKVVQVDSSKHLVRIELGKDADGGQVLSPWVPYKQTAGALKVHSPPSVGQTMSLHSETGDVEQGVADALWWSDDNKSPSNDGSTHKLTFGNVTMTMVNGNVTIDVGGTGIKINGGSAELY